MVAYKVLFNNGDAVSAERVNPALYNDIKRLRKKDKKTFIDWFIVECETEKEAIEVADKVVKSIWGKVLE